MVCVYLARSQSVFTVHYGCGVRGQTSSGVLVLDFSAIFGFPWRFFKAGSGPFSSFRCDPVLQRRAADVVMRLGEEGVL